MGHLRPSLMCLGGILGVGVAAAAAPAPGHHPRLYFTAAELPKLRALRTRGLHARVWRNLKRSADWCLGRSPRREWIAPITPDPIYENLYDRFYAIMGDLAITEHLAFAYALSGEACYGEAARQWALASCRAWAPEADGEPDGGKAYAVTRLLKGVAVAYDCLYDRLSEAERREIRETLLTIGRKYYHGYFTTPAITAPEFCTHHAIVEWASFGVLALTLLGEAPEAREWLEATVTKFEAHLLPKGLAPDGAQVEGGTFWASTLHYRLFFMDALRRVTGQDLFGPYRRFMNADLARASVAAERRADTYSQDHETVVLEPSYGLIDYYAPVLLCLAREYRDPTLQYLALWDRTLGALQRTRAITPHGEQLLFSFGGYVYVWLDPTVPARPEETRLSYHFPSVEEAYLRASWQPGDLLVGVRKGDLVLHAGGRPVLVELRDDAEAPPALMIEALDDSGAVVTLRCGDGKGGSVVVTLHRAERRVLVRRRRPGAWRWFCHGAPLCAGNEVRWGRAARLRVLAGMIADWEPEGHAPVLRTGFEKLTLADPAPAKFPRATLTPPADGEIVLEVRGRR